MKERALTTAGVLFGLMAVLQLSRVILRYSATVNGHEVPVYINAIAAIVMAGLSFWMFRAASRR